MSGKRAKLLRQQGQNPAPVQLNVNPADLPAVLCECGFDIFVQGFKMRRVSALISPDGQDGYINVPGLACMKCHTALPDKP